MNEGKLYYLQASSPLHIGCDEVYEPMTFVIDEKEGTLTHFDFLDFLKKLTVQDKKTFSDLCRKGTPGSLLEIYRFMRGRKMTGHVVGLSSGFLRDYERNMRMSPSDERRVLQELNRFTISRTSFDANTNRPYIPGSSIKGSLRTAYLNRLAGMKKSVTPGTTPSRAGGRVNSRALEQQLLEGSFSTDPFRMLKVSDFHPLDGAKTRIVYGVNEKKTPSDKPARGPYQILEVVEPGTIFVGTIKIEKPDKETGIKNPIREETLLESCRDFYSSEIEREKRQLAAVGLVLGTPAMNPGGIPLRVGRHSGAESVTIEGHRNIRIMQGRGQRPLLKDGAKTFWLAANRSKDYEKRNLLPFGWCLITVQVPEARRGDLPGLQGSEAREIAISGKKRIAGGETEAGKPVDITGLQKRFRVKK